MAEKTKKTTRDGNGQIEWPFGPRNYLVLGIALVVIVIGYITLGQGSITLAPILLVFGYCVLIPVAIVIRGRRNERPPLKKEATDQSTR